MMKNLNKNTSSALERVYSSRAEHVADLQNALEAFNDLDNQHKILEKQVNELFYLLSKSDSNEELTWQEELSQTMRTFNVNPSNKAQDYLAKANFAPSINESLKKDWDRVGEDLWISIAKIMGDKKEVKLK